MNTLTDQIPATPNWYWRQTHHDNFQVWGPEAEMRKFRSLTYVQSLDGNSPFSFCSYLDMCWWCGTHHLNPTNDLPCVENS